MKRIVEITKRIAKAVLVVGLIAVMGYIPKENLPAEAKNKMQKTEKTAYLVTSIEADAFLTDDAEEAIIVFGDRHHEKGAQLSIYDPSRAEWLILSKTEYKGAE